MDFTALATSLAHTEDGTTPDPYDNLAWLRTESPVYSVPGPGGAGSIWFVTTYEHAKQVFSDPRLSFDPSNAATPQSAPGHDPYVLARDAPEHTRLRALVTDAFSPRATARLAARVRRICAGLVDALPADRPVDLVADFALPVPELVTYELFGIPESERMPLGLGTELAIRIAFLEQAVHGEATAELHDYISHVIDYKRTHRGDDLTSSLLAKLDSGEVRDEAELEGMLYLLFATGQLSTAPFIACALVRLLSQPELMAAPLAQPRRWRGVLEEALRIDSPVQTTMPRFALTDLELGGRQIAKGDTVMVSVAGANRDPGHFSDADRYVPDRERHIHLAFGQGAHFCIGAPLARMEGEIALDTLLRRFPDITLAVAPDELAWVLGPMLRTPRAIPVLLQGAPAVTPAPSRPAFAAGALPPAVH